MLPFERKKEYLVCIDSDGTIMDTMTVKHENCFGPMFIKAMDVKEHQDEILNHWLNVNLYTLTRGINRFQGFDEICHFIENNYGEKIDGLDEFDAWLKTTKELSMNALNAYRKNVGNDSLFKKAAKWSDMVNASIVSLPPSKPFSGVKEILEKIHDEVDLVGVSSANREAVEEEWTRLHLVGYFRFVACQDKGNKTLIIKNALENGYTPEKTVMLGDALGDLDASKSNSVLFFPIIPKHETESWKRFIDEAYPRLLSGTFDNEYQNTIIQEFLDSLK